MRVDFTILTECDYEKSQKINDQFDDEANIIGLSLEIFFGNPACGPYVYAESQNLDKLKRLESKIKKIIHQRGWAVQP